MTLGRCPLSILWVAAPRPESITGPESTCSYKDLKRTFPLLTGRRKREHACIDSAKPRASCHSKQSRFCLAYDFVRCLERGKEKGKAILREERRDRKRTSCEVVVYRARDAREAPERGGRPPLPSQRPRRHRSLRTL